MCFRGEFRLCFGFVFGGLCPFGFSLGSLLGRRAVKADKGGASQEAFERAVAPGLVDTALDATHGISRATFGAKGRSAGFRFVSESVVGNFSFIVACHSLYDDLN